MDSKKFSINIFLACCAALLALTAITTAYFKINQQHNHPNTASELSGSASSATAANSEVAIQVKNLERLMAEDPGNPNYPTQIGNLLYDHGDFEKAAVYYEKSLNIHPQEPSVETDLAVCYHYIGQDDKALEILNRVIRYRPDFSPAKFNKGMVLINGKKDIRGGISVWEDLLRSDPGLPNRQDLEQRIRQLKGSSGQ
jgi:tetratricopeptide (TPR) repeat protein